MESAKVAMASTSNRSGNHPVMIEVCMSPSQIWCQALVKKLIKVIPNSEADRVKVSSEVIVTLSDEFGICGASSS